MTDIFDEFVAAIDDPAKIDVLAPTLRYAKIKPTNNCNSRCITCSYWEHKYTNELTLEEIYDTLHVFRELGIEEVMFTGGEPTLRKDLIDMVDEAKNQGFSGIGITTNSLSLKEKKLDSLVAAGLTEVVLSLEGCETHDEIRGVAGNFKKVKKNLEHLAKIKAEAKKSGPSVKIATTVMNRTISQIDGVLALARQYNATLLLNLIDNGTYFFEGMSKDLFTLHDRTTFNQMIDGLIETKRQEPGLIGNSMSSLEYARRYFDDPKQADIPCYLGYIGCEVDADGSVFSNCWGLAALGNIRKTPLKEILSSEKYRQRCADMYRKKCGGCSCGYVLNLSYHPPSVAEDSKENPEFSRVKLGYAGEKAIKANV